MSPTNRPNLYSNHASSGATDNSIYYRNENNSLAAMNHYIHATAMHIEDQAAARAAAAERHRIEIEAEAEADDIIRRINAQSARNREINIAENAVNDHQIDIDENEANDHLIDIAENEGNQHQMG